jgi:hypothetical protein
VNFAGKKDKVDAFTTWKKTHSDLLRSKEMQTALLLHLRYLQLAFQRKGLEKPETQIPSIMAYVGDLIASDEVFNNPKVPMKEPMDLLNQPLGSSVFAQWLRLGEWLPDEKSWEGRPGNISGILEKDVRSVMREQKDPQLIGTWDLEMKVEADRITTGRSEHKADEFNEITRPRLQFKQARDMILIGQPNRGLTAVIALVRTCPSHPDFPIWVAKIREMIKPPTSDQTSPPAAPDTAP